METRHDDSDGSDIFWPGYVDATTNLILNLLFLLTILIVAVFMFALELGRTSPAGSAPPPIDSPTKETKVVSAEDTASESEIKRLKMMLEKLTATSKEREVVSRKNISLESEIQRLQAMLAKLAATKKVTEAISAENISLKNEIQRQKLMLEEMALPKAQSADVVKSGDENTNAPNAPDEPAKKLAGNPKITLTDSAQDQTGGLTESVDATANLPNPQSGLSTILESDAEVVVHFKGGAVAFTEAEHDRLLESLAPIVAQGKTGIYVVVPAGFSEAKRLGFYRAMAVRNLLLEMKTPPENINISVLEGANNANASVVKVRSR